MATSTSSDEPPGRADLAAMIVPLGRALTAAELPVLRAHDLSMWGYMVLAALDREPMRPRPALARPLGADKTRLIAVLDALQRRALIQPHPAPADRRANLLSLTARGRELRES